MEEQGSQAAKEANSNAMRKAVEENQDMRRQVVLLQQTLEERDRRIKALESLLVGEKPSSSSGQGCKARATQVNNYRLSRIFKKSDKLQTIFIKK